MPNEWFFQKDNTTQGPLSDQQVRKLAELGQITPATRIRLGAGAWAMASSVKGLFPSPPKPDPPVDDFGFDALVENSIRNDGSGSRSSPVAASETATKTCPFCSEEIKSSAVKCKHCGEFLIERPVSHSVSSSAAVASPPKRSEVPVGPERTVWEARPAYASYLAAWILGSVSCFIFGVGLLIFLWAFLHRNTTKYRRTTQRIECEWGIISKRTREVKLADITAMNFEQSGIDRIFRIGNIELCTSGTSGVEVELRAVPCPKLVREDIRQACDAYGVRL